jgi:tryptophan-rich hypothetical protein
MAKKQKFPHLLGSKWTARQRTFGWRHFQVANRKNEGDRVYAELVASCDPEARFWIDARNLKNRDLWAAGWQTLEEIEILAEVDRGDGPIEDVEVLLPDAII